MNQLTERTDKHMTISSILACMSNKQLEQALADGKPMYKGIGGNSIQIVIDGISVFVKKVPITELELQPEYYMSTANVFELPTCYQYGIGSVGFGVWREVASHIMTTNWVLLGKCPNFPIMHHWRILQDVENITISDEEKAAFDKDTVYWENNKEIQYRCESRIFARHHIYLFLEFIPTHLYHWIHKQIACGEEEALSTIKLVEHQMHETIAFMESQKFVHMDAHFENILTDGLTIYFSDFGLAISNRFDLSNTEQYFINCHSNYDRCASYLHFLHVVLTSYLGKDDWGAKLREYGAEMICEIPTSIHQVLSKYVPIALKMHEFYHSIHKDKSTPYPSSELEILLQEIR